MVFFVFLFQQVFTALQIEAIVLLVSVAFGLVVHRILSFYVQSKHFTIYRFNISIVYVEYVWVFLFMCVFHLHFWFVASRGFRFSLTLVVFQTRNREV